VAYNLDPLSVVSGTWAAGDGGDGGVHPRGAESGSREEALWEVLRLAGLEDLIRAMPHGLHTHLGAAGRGGAKGGGEGGGGGKGGGKGGGEGKPGNRGGGETTITLSATHLQLIALSRLLLQRSSAKLVLLDEPAAGMEASASARLHGVSVPLIGSSMIACLIRHRLHASSGAQ
jgi:ABC-type transport system involved in cytochrome bd biosynthesis fused ATPase/permease subunit